MKNTSRDRVQRERESEKGRENGEKREGYIDGKWRGEY